MVGHLYRRWTMEYRELHEMYNSLISCKQRVDYCRNELRKALSEADDNKRLVVRFLVKEEQFDLLTVNMTRMKQKMSL